MNFSLNGIRLYRCHAFVVGRSASSETVSLCLSLAIKGRRGDKLDRCCQEFLPRCVKRNKCLFFVVSVQVIKLNIWDVKSDRGQTDRWIKTLREREERREKEIT